VSTIGAFTLGLGVFMFVVNVIKTWKSGEIETGDPWDARTLEWMTASPPKEHNFDSIPHVHSLDEFFHLKYAEDEETGELRKVTDYEAIIAEQEANADAHIHLPSPSYWPIVLAVGLPIIAYGVIFSHVLAVVGAAIVLLGIFGWSLEPSVAEESDYDPPAGTGESTKELTPVG
jgi:cytochrome c oxidase subunit 1